MNLAQTSDHLHIHQTKYVERKLIEYGLESAPPASCPLNPKEYLKAATTHQIFELQQLGVSYRGIVGSLNYLSVLTRPDISYAVSVLSQHLEHPGIQHYRAAQQVFCYLSGTKQVGLLFTKTSPLSLSAQVDADWGNCPDTRRLVTGYLVLTANQLLSWKSTRQPTVSLSSTEAEYKALSDLGREIAWFASLTSELHLNCQPREVPIGVDNQGAIDLAKREVSQNSFRTKHMDIRLHFVREQVASHLLKLHYIRTTENSAHFLTKPTGRCTIRRSLQAIGVTTLPSDPAPTLAAQSTPGCWDSAKVSKKNKQETRQITHNNHEQRSGTRSAASASEELDKPSGSHDQPTNAEPSPPIKLNSRISVNNKEKPTQPALKIASSLISRISFFPEKKRSLLLSGTIKPPYIKKEQR